MSGPTLISGDGKTGLGENGAARVVTALSLDLIVAHPELARALSAQARAALIAQAAAAIAVLAAPGIADEQHSAPPPSSPGPLLTAAQMAQRLALPESRIRSDARVGKIPVVRIGRWTRFDPIQVEQAVRSRG